MLLIMKKGINLANFVEPEWRFKLLAFYGYSRATLCEV